MTSPQTSSLYTNYIDATHFQKNYNILIQAFTKTTTIRLFGN